MNFSIFLTVIIFSCALFHPCTNDGSDGENIDDASITSAEINAIEDPKLKSKVMREKQRVSDMKDVLYTTLSKSFFSSFVCAIGNIRYDLEFAYRSKLDDGTIGYDVGSQPLNERDYRTKYPKPDRLNGVAFIKIQFPNYVDQEKLMKYFLHWFKFVRRNATSPFARRIRQELKKLGEAENRELDDELYREFAFMLSRSYLLCVFVNHELMGQIMEAQLVRRSKKARELSLEAWLDRKMPGGWFFSKRQLTYVNLLRRCRDTRNAEYLGLGVSSEHVIPYTEKDECPQVRPSNALKVLPSLLKNHVASGVL